MSTETSLTERWLWLVVSFGLALFAIGVQLAQELLNKRDETDEPIHNPFSFPPWAVQTLRMLYAVGIPALALLWRGALTERILGLKPVHWMQTSEASNWATWVSDTGWAGLLVLGTWGILSLGNLSTPHNSEAITHRRPDIALREAVFHQVHWAFYREPFVLLWGITTGAWLGLLLAEFETLINPSLWARLHSPEHGRNFVIRAGIAVMSVMLYIQTQNLWIAILADTVLGWLLGQQKKSNLNDQGLNEAITTMR